MIVIRYAEIGLKGKNRSFFEKCLVQNIKNKIKGEVTRPRGRILLETDDKQAMDKLQFIFGIASYSMATKINSDIEEIKNKALELIKKEEFESFKVNCQRMDKEFPLKSPEVNKIVGEFLFENMDKKVSMKNPDITLNIEIMPKQVFIFTKKIQGQGGMPVGSAGKVLSLLSGGIDSPVSSLLMMKRGCKVDFIHFHNYPYVKKKSIDKVKELFQLVNQYQNKSELILVPFTEIQKEIVIKCPAKYRILLYRRMMLRISERLSKDRRAIVSGESLGQVSSQTLENMSAVGKVTEMLFLRPLVGMDKKEIIDLAKHYGTYEKSIEPHEDCCTYFVPKQPETKAKLEHLEEAEKLIEWEKLLEECIGKIEYVSKNPQTL